MLWTLPLDIAGKYAGTAGGMMNTGFGVAGMVSPVVFGYLIETTGSYNVPFNISACLLAVGVVAALFIDTSEDGRSRRGTRARAAGGGAARRDARRSRTRGAGALERHHLRRPLRWRK